MRRKQKTPPCLPIPCFFIPGPGQRAVTGLVSFFSFTVGVVPRGQQFHSASQPLILEENQRNGVGPERAI